jgi:hypothetical protein
MLSGAVHYLLEFCLSIASIRMALVFGFELRVDMRVLLIKFRRKPSSRLLLSSSDQHIRYEAPRPHLLHGL